MQCIVKKRLVNYEQFGQGSENLLILHGWGHSIAQWRSAAIHCSKKYTVTVLDFPGFGNSEEPEQPWDTFDYAQFTMEFMDKLSLHNPIIMGHSFGGRIGTVIAARFPHAISGLVLVDPGGVEIKNFRIKIRILIYKLMIKPIRNLFASRIKGFFGSSGYRNATPMMRQILVKVVNQDLRNLFGRIAIPVTVIWGSNDKVLPVEYVKIYKKLIPTADIKIIWGADHSPNSSKPAEFLSVLDDVLKL